MCQEGQEAFRQAFAVGRGRGGEGHPDQSLQVAFQVAWEEGASPRGAACPRAVEVDSAVERLEHSLQEPLTVKLEAS